MSLRCRSCNTEFHDNASLEVHYQYAHSNGIESLSSSDTSRPSTEPDVEPVGSTESNNNNSFFKFQNVPERGNSASSANMSTPDTTIMTNISPGNVSDSRDFHLPPSISSAASQQHHHTLHHHSHQPHPQHHHQMQSPQPLHHQQLHLQQQQQQHQQHQQHQQQRDLIYDMQTSSVGPAAPPASSLAGLPQGAGFEGFGANNAHEYARSPPVMRSSQSNATAYAASYGDQRFHPYYKSVTMGAFNELAAGRPMGSMPNSPHSQSTLLTRCEKCEFQTNHVEHLAHHYRIVHHSMPPFNVDMPAFNPRFGNGLMNGGGAEPQAEILDLDSHKVHVYQPPNDEDSEDSNPQRPLNTWHQPQHAPHQQQPPLPHPSMQAQNGSTQNGQGHTPLPSPDFGNVSTTTDNIESLQSSTRSPYYEHGSTPTAQISSTDNPNGSGGISGAPASTGRSSSKSSKNSNGAWKSNEARRPKTYNCSACNKWFTSSGHLKRHYNTTLHKNAVKQSGAPDPATMPVSHHHHPQKDPPYPSSRQQAKNAAAAATASTTESDNLIAGNIKQESDAYIGQNSSSQLPTSTVAQQQQQKQSITSVQQSQPATNNAFLQQNPPNLIAGPSELSGGLPQFPQQHQPQPYHTQHLQHPSFIHQSADIVHQQSPLAPQHPQDFIKSPSPITTIGLQQQQPPQRLHHHSNHMNFRPAFASTPSTPPPQSHNIQFFPHMPTKVYPNFQSPHVSTTRQVITTSSPLSGNDLMDVAPQQPLDADANNECTDSKLPSFACLPKNTWNQAHLDQILCTLETTTGESNVGGQYASKEVETTPPKKAEMSAAANPYETFVKCELFIKCEPIEPIDSPDFDGQEQQRFEAEQEQLQLRLLKRHRLQHRQKQLLQSSLVSRSSTSTSEEEPVTSSTGIILERRSNAATNRAPGGGSTLKRATMEDMRSSDTTVSPFNCQKCRKTFNKACYLTQHNKSFHSGEKPYKCSRCGKRFPDSAQYDSHWAKHGGDKPFKCDVCPKAFNHKTDLRRHACLHTDSRPFSCDLCGKGFIRKDHMLKHRETHKNRKNASSSATSNIGQVRTNKVKQQLKAIK